MRSGGAGRGPPGPWTATAGQDGREGTTSGLAGIYFLVACSMLLCLCSCPAVSGPQPSLLTLALNSHCTWPLCLDPLCCSLGPCAVSPTYADGSASPAECPHAQHRWVGEGVGEHRQVTGTLQNRSRWRRAGHPSPQSLWLFLLTKCVSEHGWVCPPAHVVLRVYAACKRKTFLCFFGSRVLPTPQQTVDALRPVTRGPDAAGHVKRWASTAPLPGGEHWQLPFPGALRPLSCLPTPGAIPQVTAL